jgi:hypothetical protein
VQAGERQVSPELSGIRRDHRARYQWAARQLPPASRVLDLACGVGYGAAILAAAGHRVVAVDRDADAIDYGRTYYSHQNIEYVRGDAADPPPGGFDAVVCFETIEHLADPLPMLRAFCECAPLLLASVPNEEKFPFRNYKFHHRHYTRAEFAALLAGAGFEPTASFGQAGTESDVEADCNGRTVIVRARRTSDSDTARQPVPQALAAPKHVVILGLGPSLEQYVDLVKRLGGRKAFADEVWAINALGDVVRCDRIFHMDDVRIQEIRAEAAPQSNIARMLDWLKEHPGPIYTSRAKEGYPGLVEFPLEDVINALGYSYFNGTAAYAAAYAIYLGVEKISLFGCDYSYANSHHAERGRACLEFWLGIAAARGIKLGMAEKTSLLDTCEEPADPHELRVYGYDSVRVRIDATGGTARITFEPLETLPTAAEIEAAYDHAKHPNPLVAERAVPREG